MAQFSRRQADGGRDLAPSPGSPRSGRRLGGGFISRRLGGGDQRRDQRLRSRPALEPCAGAAAGRKTRWPEEVLRSAVLAPWLCCGKKKGWKQIASSILGNGIWRRLGLFHKSRKPELHCDLGPDLKALLSCFGLFGGGFNVSCYLLSLGAILKRRVPLKRMENGATTSIVAWSARSKLPVASPFPTWDSLC